MPPKKKIRVDSNQTKLTFQSSKRSAGAVENATQLEDAAALDRQAGDAGNSTSPSSTSRSSEAAPRSTGDGDCLPANLQHEKPLLVFIAALMAFAIFSVSTVV